MLAIVYGLNDDSLGGLPVCRPNGADGWFAVNKVMWIDPSLQITDFDAVDVPLLHTDTINQAETKIKNAVLAKATAMGRSVPTVIFQPFKKL